MLITYGLSWLALFVPYNISLAYVSSNETIEDAFMDAAPRLLYDAVDDDDVVVLGLLW